VAAALDTKTTARDWSQIDDAIESASETIDGGEQLGAGMLRRRFYPQVETRTFDWPNGQYARSWRLWLDSHELVSVDSIVSGGVTLDPADYLLRPDHGPPYDRVEINLGSSAAWSSGDTHQRAVAITGVWNYPTSTAPAGTLAEDLDASETGVDVSATSAIGVGSLLAVGDELMVVRERSMLDTGQNLGSDLAAQNNVVSVPVADGTLFATGETILIGAERMRVIDIAGNSLIVKRAWDGSTLAAHTSGADIYAPRTLTVERGVLGTTAAAHSTSAAVRVHQFPGLVRDLCVALALNQVLQEGSGYARTSGAGESQREFIGRGLAAIRKDAMRAYCRIRVGAV